MIFFAGLFRSLVMRMVGSSCPRPATAIWRSVPGYLLKVAAVSSMTRTRRVLPPARAIVIAVQSLAGSPWSAAVSLGGGTVRVDNTGTGTGTGAAITVPLNAVIDTVGGTTTTLDTNGADNGFTLSQNVRGTGTLSLTGGGAVNLSTATAQTVSANLSSAGTAANLVKQGAGTTTLTGSLSGFTGNVTVSGGRLDVPSDLGSGAMTVADGAALSGEPQQVTTLNLGTTAGVVNTLHFDPTTSGALTTGVLNSVGRTVLNLTAAPASAGLYPAIQYGTRSGAGTFEVADATTFRQAPVVIDSGSAINVDIKAGLNLNWSGVESGAWNLNTAKNWTNSTPPCGASAPKLSVLPMRRKTHVVQI